jgi:putative DNA primase/helicase
VSKEPSDFNDLKKTKGLRVVKKQVDAVIDAEKGVRYGVFTVKPHGVYWTRKEDEDPAFFCSPLSPVGLARSTKGDNFSIVFTMVDPDKITRKFVLPLSALHRAGGEEARLAFAERGGFFGAGVRTRQAFSDFCNCIVAHSRNLPRVTLVAQTGWLRMKERSAFVLPDMTAGDSLKESIVLLNPESTLVEHPTRGTLAEWREKVGRFCMGNSRLLLAVSISFAGPLLEPLNRESGGFHLVGPSSSGKTTLLAVAASVLGPPREIIKTMNATASAFEVQASHANDSSLLLDELGEAPPEQLGGVIYKLSNGVGRGRADQAGNARERRTWRLLFMTTGETDLESMMKAAGKRTYAGQSLRHANIPADTGHCGVFEKLHGLESGAALSEYLRQETMACYGSPFREFLKKLVEERNREPLKLLERLKAIIERFKFQAIPQGADGQVIRVASRFGLIAAGGELATEYGITGWPVDEAFNGVLVCFNTWLERRGTIGKTEVESLIQQVESFFELHGESRFAPMETEGVRGPARPVLNRAGFRKITVSAVTNDSVAEFYVLPSAFREMVTGFDLKWAAAVLAERGVIRKDGKGKHCILVRLPGMGPTRCYHFPARDAGEPDQEQERAGSEEPPVIDLDAAG